ncbi:MAG: hypothetical protein NVSMB64_05010 [Candidatus Velthaea sp.]
MVDHRLRHRMQNGRGNGHRTWNEEKVFLHVGSPGGSHTNLLNDRYMQSPEIVRLTELSACAG